MRPARLSRPSSEGPQADVAAARASVSSAVSSPAYARMGSVAGRPVNPATAVIADLSAVYFALRGHKVGCSVKKGFVPASGWWERI